MGQFIDPGTPNYTKMPTVRWFPRGYQYRHYYTCFERFAMTKLKMRYKRFIAVQMFLMSRKRRRGQLTPTERRRAMLRIMFCMRRFLQLKSDILKKAVFTYQPPDGVETHGVDSAYWDDDMFRAQFRFKRPELRRLMAAMHLTDKFILCGRKGKAQYFPADICMMILLRCLAYPSLFVDLLLIFGLPSNRICYIFHSMVDYLYEKYAKKLNQFMIWKDHFSVFPEMMQRAGALYPNLICIFDGNFKGICRPGGLGNSGCRLDQSEMYTGEKAQHGIKYLVAQFPNGMTSLAGPFKGKAHDGAMLTESGWTQILAEELTVGRFSSSPKLCQWLRPVNPSLEQNQRYLR